MPPAPAGKTVRNSPMRISMFVSLGVLALAPALAAQGTPPNVLIIIADDLGTDKVGAYSTVAPPTPNIDLLAASGLRFTNAWASPVCSPTRAGIHTGRYGIRTGVRHRVRPNSPANSLPLGETTLPELFDGPTPSNYATALIGKWHLDNRFAPGGVWGPVAHGWDVFVGIVDGMVTSYCNWPRAVATKARPTPQIQVSTDYATTRTVDDALNWIAVREPTGAPWVCYVAFQAPHGPVHAPPPQLHTQRLPPWPPCTNVSGEVTRFLPDFYGAMVEAMDTEIGRLLFTLQQRGELANTNIFFLGDNGTPTCSLGGAFGANQGKGTVYQGGVKVPFIVSGPAVQQPGRDVTDMVDVVDLYLTIAELCGVDGNIPANVTLDSQSLMPYLANQTPPATRQFLFTEVGPVFDTCTNRGGGVFHRGAATIRDAAGNKLHRSQPWDSDRFVEKLFDLRVDPFERNPLPLHGPVYTNLKAGLLGFGCGPLCK